VPAGDPQSLARLDRFLAPPIHARSCGAYDLRSDLDGAALASAAATCSTIAGALEVEIGSRFGLRPAHPPRGTIVLFASRRRFRESVAAAGDLPQGYAGWSEARLGVVALPAGDLEADELARTLAHELAHLAERRLFGFPRPRWLSEGLADALSDSASARGFAPLAGFDGAEAARTRWVARVASSTAGHGDTGPLERLVGLEWDQFDAGAPSLDYELAALFVRFLLLDPELAPRFRAWLHAQTVQQRSTESLPSALATGWPSLERRFASWIGGGARGRPRRRRRDRQRDDAPAAGGADPRARGALRLVRRRAARGAEQSRRGLRLHHDADRSPGRAPPTLRPAPAAGATRRPSSRARSRRGRRARW
jgi:hypothetical protein